MLTIHTEPAPLIEKKVCAPQKSPCPICGKRGRRERTRTYRVRHLAHGRAAFWEVTVGVYYAKCQCCRQVMRQVNGRVIPVRKRVKYFTATVDGFTPHAGYTDAVRQKVTDLLVRDRLTNDQVIEHLREDFHLKVSVGFIYHCLAWSKKRAA